MAEWPIKLDLKVSEETTDKIVNALLDLISPITQPAGLVGQYVEQRRKTLTIIFEKGLKKAQEANEEIQVPPPKFLIEFADRASREDAESELIEMWANLLAEASTNYDPALNTYIQILAEIGPEEANLLKEVAKEYPFQAAHDFPFVRNYEVRLTLEKGMNDISLDPNESQASAEKFARKMTEIKFFGPISLFYVELSLNESGERPVDDENKEYAEGPGPLAIGMTPSQFQRPELQLRLLERNRLIDLRAEVIHRTASDGCPTNRVTFRLAEATPLGLDFVARCQGETTQHKSTS